jgi:hypothetical protein
MSTDFDRAQVMYERMEPREPIKIGQCMICGWPVYLGDWYEQTFNRLRHCDCKLREENNEY